MYVCGCVKVILCHFVLNEQQYVSCCCKERCNKNLSQLVVCLYLNRLSQMLNMLSRSIVGCLRPNRIITGMLRCVRARVSMLCSMVDNTSPQIQVEHRPEKHGEHDEEAQLVP